jgi:hypothetical protein
MLAGLYPFLTAELTRQSAGTTLIKDLLKILPAPVLQTRDSERGAIRTSYENPGRRTADAVAAALLEVQGQDISAIPHVDALICEQRYRKRVCEVLGKQIFPEQIPECFPGWSSAARYV